MIPSVNKARVADIVPEGVVNEEVVANDGISLLTSLGECQVCSISVILKSEMSTCVESLKRMTD